ncbi:MAG: ABC transporter substrate-binding protein [Chloroflexi bacterium]|nr:ABC transporter substrate-binding protein [Chloroflexota bacterium]
MAKIGRLLSIAGVLVLVLAACGPAATATPTSTPASVAPTATPVPGTTPVPTPTPTRAAPTATAGPAATVAPKAGGTLRVMSGTPSTLDPHVSITRDGTFIYALFDTLLQTDKDMQLRPGLAESWSMADPTTMVLKLRKGVKFLDGTSFDANVAKWNLDRIMDPKTPSSLGRPALPALASWEVVDDYTFKVKLSRPSAQTVNGLAQWANSMVSPAALTMWGKDLGLHPTGTGAFIFEKWVSDTYVEVKRNPDYWKAPLPYVGQIRWTWIPDSATQAAMLLTGKVDMMEVTQPEDVSRIQAAGFRTIEGVGEISAWAYFNPNRPPFNEWNFRQAMTLGLDREGLVKLVMRGRGKPTSTLIPDVHPEHNSNLPVVQRDVAKAKELLAKSSYKGEVIELGCWPGVAAAPPLCEAMQAQWREIGINVQVLMHAAAVYGSVLSRIDYSVALAWNQQFPLEYRIMRYLHSAGSNNRGRYAVANPDAARRIDELAELIDGSIDWSVRKPAFDEIQKIVYDEALDLFMFNPIRTFALADRVQGYQRYLAKEWYHEIWLKD